MTIYLKELNEYTNGVTSTLFFTQCCYWYTKMGKPFYKFTNPCKNPNPLYKPGDSWAEELGFTRHQLNGAFNKTSTLLRRGHQYDLLKCELILRWRLGNGATYYIPNYPKLATLGLDEKLLQKHFPHFLKWKKQFAISEKRTWEIEFSASQQWNFGLSIIQETKQQNNQNNTQERPAAASFNEKVLIDKNEKSEKEKSCAKKEKIVLPYDSFEFQQTWSAWKQYKANQHSFRYSIESEQAALFQLQQYDEKFSIQIIQKAISENWKGFQFTETPEKFQTYLKTKNNANRTTALGYQSGNHVDRILAKHAKPISY